MDTPIIFRRGLFRIGEAWFCEPGSQDKIDVLKIRQCSSPLNFPGCAEFSTLLINLEKDADDILSSMSKGTRYKIHRAAKRDNLKYSHMKPVTINDIKKFCRFYNDVIGSKSASRADPNRLQRYARHGCLDLSNVQSETGHILAWHAHIIINSRARLLLSASKREIPGVQITNAGIGRANRYAHWQDMLRYKKNGIRVYDFGGWYSGHEDKKKLTINEFKAGFGGDVVKNYNCEKALTIFGHLYRVVRRLRKKFA